MILFVIIWECGSIIGISQQMHDDLKQMKVWLREKFYSLDVWQGTEDVLTGFSSCWYEYRQRVLSISACPRVTCQINNLLPLLLHIDKIQRIDQCSIDKLTMQQNYNTNPACTSSRQLNKAVLFCSSHTLEPPENLFAVLIYDKLQLLTSWAQSADMSNDEQKQKSRNEVHESTKACGRLSKVHVAFTGGGSIRILRSTAPISWCSFECFENPGKSGELSWQHWQCLLLTWQLTPSTITWSRVHEKQGVT